MKPFRLPVRLSIFDLIGKKSVLLITIGSKTHFFGHGARAVDQKFENQVNLIYNCFKFSLWNLVWRYFLFRSSLIIIHFPGSKKVKPLYKTKRVFDRKVPKLCV